MFSSSRLAGLLCLTLLSTACQQKEEETARPNPTQNGFRQASETITADPDPTLSDWETEVFTSATGLKLKEIKDFLRATITDPPAGTCQPLSGFPMTSLPVGGAFHVQRASNTEGEPMDLSEALQSLRSKFSSDKATMAEIKVVKVDLSGENATTALNVQIADSGLQINARWIAQWTKDNPPALLDLRVTSHEECLRGSGGTLVDSTGAVLAPFVEKAQVVHGMDHWVGRIETLLGIEIGGWHGLATADVNNDGLDDIYLCDGGGLPNRLLVQQQDGTVLDRSQESGLGLLDHSFGSLFADFDNDGDQDAAIALASGVLILENDGTGTFSPANAKSFPSAVPYSLAAADYDEDGDLDLFASCYVQRAGANRHSFVARPLPYHDATNGGRNELLRNEGSLRFRNVTKEVGLLPGNSKFSYSASWEDYDQDGDMDLYVANDFGGNNLYRNTLRESGKPAFTDVAAEAGVRDIAAGMSACWGDFDNNGLVDLYVGNMFSSAGNRIAFQDKFKSEGKAETRALYQRHARGNSLFQNLGQGRFRDVSVSSGTTMGRWAWSSLFADLDNNGWEDLLVTNGFITQRDPDDL
tara:strand:+ start:4463 stop:6214 length:1752 start_codon:yes stop_codon:yes gene_type:complete